jgi:hypothetical protein
VTNNILTPQKAANRLVHIVETFSVANQLECFPINVVELALEAANIFNWDDPISEVKAAEIKGFEGALFPNDGKKKWLLLYNSGQKSQGRIRFTQAHELGHYILHRMSRESFQCSDADMLDWSKDDLDLEAQADLFASYLLMPLNDYRKHLPSTVDLEALSYCADRYGVSLIAAILKWLEYTQEKAVLVMSRDGYMDWAWSSESALKAGAFFKTKNNVIPIPIGSLAANPSVKHDRTGQAMSANVWFKHADPLLSLREMKINAEQYDCVLSLLCLPRDAKVWPLWHEEEI